MTDEKNKGGRFSRNSGRRTDPGFDRADRMRLMEKRRRELLSRRPQHYCPRCTALAYAEDDSCLECGLMSPEQGWPHLHDSITEPWLGREIEGRYLITRLIGKGASASVYRAESLAISRQFAIKLIEPPRSESSGPSPEQIAARLEREIDALGRLRNPHIVRFYEVIELPLNHIGVVMDFVEGDTLEQLVARQGYLSVSRATTLLRQIANGVYEAHLVGMTHRDLKPENIMVEQLPAGDDFVHVLDFGIVHVEGEVSMTQGFIGTPLYASPEQARGQAVDHRSDIYALGAIFFYLLSGQPVFTGRNVLEVLRQHAEDPPPGVSQVRPDMGIPDELERMIARMLAKRPEERPQSLSEVIQQLDHLSYGASESKGTIIGGEVTSSASDAGIQEPDATGEDDGDPPALRTSPGVPFSHASSVLSEGLEVPFVPGDSRLPSGVSSSSSGAEVEEMAREQSHAPQSGIFGRVRRPSSASEARHNGAAERSATNGAATAPSHSGHEAASGSSPPIGGGSQVDEVELPSGADLSRRAFTREYRFVLIADQLLHLWDMRAGTHDEISIRHADRVVSMALGADFVLVGRSDGIIERVSLGGGASDKLFESVFSDTIAGLATDPSGEVMLGVMRSGRVYISDARRDANDWVRVRGGEQATGMTLSPRGDLFAVTRQGGVVEIARISDPKKIIISFEVGGGVEAMAFSDDGYLMGLSTERGTVHLHQVVNGKHIFEVDVGDHYPIGLFFSTERSLMGYLEDDARICVADLQALHARQRLQR